MVRVAEAGCILCRRLGYGDTPAQVHHIRTGTGAGQRAGHLDTIALCFEHHVGQTGLHGMGRKAFERHSGVTELELLAETKDMLK